uniref:Uncharacterized protein n=1 Tax=Arundo donax TaxID=35708 RepID=A0A0A9E909_ARUDO
MLLRTRPGQFQLCNNIGLSVECKKTYSYTYFYSTTT